MHKSKAKSSLPDKLPRAASFAAWRGREDPSRAASAHCVLLDKRLDSLGAHAAFQAFQGPNSLRRSQ
eukprot:6062571-Pleurochrysis_carterae.AAC.1